MTRIRLVDVLDSTGAVLVRGETETPDTCTTTSVVGVSTDTRTLGEGELFIALDGPNFDGNDFVGVAARAGAAALLVRQLNRLSLGGSLRPVLLVRLALGV